MTNHGAPSQDDLAAMEEFIHRRQAESVSGWHFILMQRGKLPRETHAAWAARVLSVPLVACPPVPSAAQHSTGGQATSGTRHRTIRAVEDCTEAELQTLRAALRQAEAAVPQPVKTRKD